MRVLLHNGMESTSGDQKGQALHHILSCNTAGDKQLGDKAFELSELFEEGMEVVSARGPNTFSGGMSNLTQHLSHHWGGGYAGTH